MARGHATLATRGHVDPLDERGATHAATATAVATNGVAIVTPASAASGSVPKRDKPSFGARAAFARELRAPAGHLGICPGKSGFYRAAAEPPATFPGSAGSRAASAAARRDASAWASADAAASAATDTGAGAPADASAATRKLDFDERRRSATESSFELGRCYVAGDLAALWALSVC